MSQRVRDNIQKSYQSIRKANESLKTLSAHLPASFEEKIGSLISTERADSITNRIDTLLDSIDRLEQTSNNYFIWRFSLWSPLYIEVNGGGAIAVKFTILNRAVHEELQTINKQTKWLNHATIAAVILVLILVFILAVRPAMDDLILEKSRIEDLHRVAVYQSLHDDLTAIGNRNAFYRHMTELQQRGPRGLALLVIDLDGFKQINDFHGHGAGDETLCRTAERIKAFLGDKGSTFRIGGDEFVAVLETDHGDTELACIGRGLADALRLPIRLEQCDIELTASVGISRLAIGEHFDLDRFFSRADKALLIAKKSHNGLVKVFGDQDSRLLEEQDFMAAKLATALEQDRLQPYYQPIVDLADNRVVAIEALIRWQDCDGNIHQPSEFLSVIESHGMMHEMTDRLLERVAIDRRTMCESGFGEIGIGINLAECSLVDPGLDARVSRIAHGSRLDWLHIEVLETVLLGRDSSTVGENVDALITRGIRVALDDFGTGHASLTHLRMFPCTSVKIDRSFIADMMHREDARLIVKGLIDMTRSLGKSIVAEGIENRAQALQLASWGVHFGQGFLFAPPMPIDRLIANLRGLASVRNRPVVTY
ncbi:MAG: EAL domain-containing protein [Geminicoccaceae bacterium]